MRISDWSSDVFSSDLFGRLVEDPARGVELVVQHRRARALQAFLQVGRGFVAGDDRVAAERGQQAVAGDACGIEQLIALCLAALHQAVAIGRAQAHRLAAVVAAGATFDAPVNEIGRGPCREREGPYVWNSVVDESLKKNKSTPYKQIKHANEQV